MDNIEHLTQVCENRLEQQNMGLERIRNGEDPQFVIPFFEGDNVVFAINEIYFKKDFQKSKEFFFKAARIAEYMSVKYDRRIIDSGIYQISYALLSDNIDLIERYSTLRNTKNHELNIGFQIPNAVQNILLDRKDELEANIRNLERFVQLPKFKWWASLVDVFKGFLLGEAEKIEAGLQLMLKTHKKRNTDPLVSKFLSVDTAGLCKLAWMKGFEINLKDDLVPLELMPIKPLQQYKESSVLNELK